MFAAIRPNGKPDGVWALPKGLVDRGEAAEATALREVAEETGVEGRTLGKLGDVRYVYTRAGSAIFKVVSFYLLRYSRGRLGELAPEQRTRSPRRAGCRSTRRAACSPTAASARWPNEHVPSSNATLYDAPAFADVVTLDDAVYALNFYSPLVADQLRARRKTATIRLGDKSRKYKKGMVVQVLCGARFGPREQVFDAVIDKVEVKTLAELSPREIEHDNPEIRRTEEMAHLPRPALQPRRHQRGHGHGDPLLRDRGPSRRASGPGFRIRGAEALVGPASAAPHSSHSTANADAIRAPQPGQRAAAAPRTAGSRRAARPRSPRSSAGRGRSRGRTRPSRRASCRRSSWIQLRFATPRTLVRPGLPVVRVRAGSRRDHERG